MNNYLSSEQRVLLEENINNIFVIKNPTEITLKTAFDANVSPLKFKIQFSVKFQLIALDITYLYFLKITNPCLEVQLYAVSKRGDSINFIPDPCYDVQMAAVLNDRYSIQYIKNPHPNVQVRSVKSIHTDVIKYIKDPCPEAQMAAVQNCGFAIEHIPNPSEQIQIEAINKDPWSIQFIKQPSIKMQMIAVKLRPHVSNLIHPISDIAMIEAIKQDYTCVRYCQDNSLRCFSDSIRDETYYPGCKDIITGLIKVNPYFKFFKKIPISIALLAEKDTEIKVDYTDYDIKFEYGSV